jgi:ribosomal protein L11 methyltransferase
LARAWPALDIHVPACDPQLQDLVLAELDDHHPTAIQEQDDTQPLRVFFAAANHRDQAAHALGVAFGSRLFVAALDVDDGDWAARSQAALHAVTVGRITVAPPWEMPVQTHPLFLVIQPSMGFGTGHHATTRLMLGALQQLDVRDRRVLDIGCGSGVLAIAGARLGAQSAVAVDNDPDALLSAAENVELNAVGDRVQLMEAELHKLTEPADIVLANLTGALLERHAATLAGLVAPGGYLIVSGLMGSETTVLPALSSGLTLEREDSEDEWRCGVFQKSFQTY